MRIINRTNFNDEAILIKVWGGDLENVQYLIFEKEGARSVFIGGMLSGARICALVEL